jgi:hypothetical protein
VGFRTLSIVKKSSNSEYYTPSSESFRIYSREVFRSEKGMTRSQQNNSADGCWVWVRALTATVWVILSQSWKNALNGKMIILKIVQVCDRDLSGARGSVVGWGTMLQAGRSRIWFPTTSLDFFNWPNPSSRTVALGLTQRLREMSIRNLPGGKGRPAREAGSLTATCEPIILKIWEPRRLTTLWASTACYRDSFTFFMTYLKILF